MSKNVKLLFVVALVVALVGVLGVTALAQGPQRSADGTTPEMAPAYGGGNRGGQGFGGADASLMSVAAEEFGVTVPELVVELEGKSIAQLAEDYEEVSVDDIVEAYLASRVERLNEMVEAGRISQDQADLMLVKMEENVLEQINEPFEPKGAGLNGDGEPGDAYEDADGDGVCDLYPDGDGPRGGQGGRGQR